MSGKIVENRAVLLENLLTLTQAKKLIFYRNFVLQLLFSVLVL